MLECCCRKLKKNPQNTNGRLAIPAPAGLLVFSCTVDCDDIKAILVCNLYVIDNTERYVKMNSDVHAISICIHKVTTVLLVLFLIMATGRFVELLKLVSLNLD